MAKHRHLAVIALSACMAFLPVKGGAETVMGSRLLVAPTSLAHSESAPRAKPKSPRFDWMANGAANRTSGKAKLVNARARVIQGKGSWICSPAGFGQGSRCYSG